MEAALLASRLSSGIDTVLRKRPLTCTYTLPLICQMPHVAEVTVSLSPFFYFHPDLFSVIITFFLHSMMAKLTNRGQVFSLGRGFCGSVAYVTVLAMNAFLV